MTIWHKFAPDLRCPRIQDIPLELLKERGIEGILFDLDNTITAWHSFEIPADTNAWLQNLAAFGFKTAIVSNNKGARVKQLSDKLAMPFISDAIKPRRKGFLQAAALLELPVSKLAMVGDQLITDIWGGNRAGLYTIFVDSLHPKEHWGTTHIFRPMERFVLKRLDK